MWHITEWSASTAMLANYFFIIAILEGEPRRFEPRPNLEASMQTQWKTFNFFAILHTIIN
jgi:hypothetical protein